MNLFIYYHMPIRMVNEIFLFNPVMGTFIESLLPYFKKITIISFNRNNDSAINYEIIDNKNLEIICLGREGRYYNYFNKLYRSKKRLSKLKIQNTDVVLFRMPTPYFYVVWKYLKYPKNIILLFVANEAHHKDSKRNSKLSFKNNFIKIRSMRKNNLIKKLLERSNCLMLCNSADLAKKWGSTLKKQFTIIHTSSLNKKDIRNIDNINLEKNKIDKIDKLRLLFLSRVEVDKGIFEAIEAVVKLNIDYNVPSVLNIVGPIEHMSENIFFTRINKMKASKFVNYQGTIKYGSELLKFYFESDYFLMPSYHEGMPKVLWESLSQGTPAISTNVGGISHFLKNEEDALLIKPHSSESIVKAVLRLEDDVRLREKIRINGLKKVQKYTSEYQGKLIFENAKKYFI